LELLVTETRQHLDFTYGKGTRTGAGEDADVKVVVEDKTSESSPPLVRDEVVRRAAAGDRRAFEELFRKHSPWVYGRLRRMLGQRADLEDLVQDVFLRAYKSLPSYRGQARFESWLRRITARVAYDEIRSKCCSPRLELIDYEARVGRSDDMEQREALRHIMRLIDEIPPKNRIVLLLHDVEGYTAEEIRLVVGTRSANTVRSRLRLARAELHRRARSNPALGWLYENREE
jgi:RNA polymerase sigma factor (sigma-70 family)